MLFVSLYATQTLRAHKATRNRTRTTPQAISTMEFVWVLGFGAGCVSEVIDSTERFIDDFRHENAKSFLQMLIT